MTSEGNRPKWNLRSLLLQVIGLVISVGLFALLANRLGYFALLVFWIYVFFCLCGVFCAVTSIWRQEKWAFLSWLGLIVNALPLLWLAMNLKTQIIQD